MPGSDAAQDLSAQNSDSLPPEFRSTSPKIPQALPSEYRGLSNCLQESFDLFFDSKPHGFDWSLIDVGRVNRFSKTSSLPLLPVTARRNLWIWRLGVLGRQPRSGASSRASHGEQSPSTADPLPPRCCCEGQDRRFLSSRWSRYEKWLLKREGVFA